MTLTTFNFFVFLIIALLAFYIIKPLQKYTLLLASMFFYINISVLSTKKMLCLMLFIFGITYCGALLIDYFKGTLKNIILAFCICSIIGTLVVFKYLYNVVIVFQSLFSFSGDFSWLEFAPIIGISYYALSAIGYIVDVYWDIYKPVKNPVNVALFIFYFPQLISGPFTRFSDMNVQFNQRTSLQYNNITNGLRRMALGYFKKLVISERFGIIVETVYSSYNDYSFIGIVGATLCYAVQLYTDFSGCMDIIMGVSTLFGIELPENFKGPFCSESIQEFWQRWHISLGLWFKDYFMYPLQKSKPIQTIGKFAKNKWGKKAGKKVSFYSAMFLLWVVIGLWHGGTGYYFIASGMIPCVLLLAGDLGQPLANKIISIFKIDTNKESWHTFRRIRTLLLICICWMVCCSGGTYTLIDIIKHMFTTTPKLTSFTVSMQTFGIDTLDMLLMSIGVAIIYWEHKCEFNGKNLLKKTDEFNLAFRLLFIFAEVLTIMLFGMVGASAFIYFQF